MELGLQVRAGYDIFLASSDKTMANPGSLSVKPLPIRG